jgi:threonine synthase
VARDESGGTIEAVSDAEIMSAHRRLSQEEGLLVEPASAAGLGLLLRRAANHQVPADGPVVCVLTGHGLKDPDAITRGIKLPPAIEPTSESLLAVVRANPAP